MTFEVASPEEYGFCSTRLNRLSDWLAEHVDATRIAGGSLYIERHGKCVFFEANGFADIEHERPFLENTIVRIYSMSKPVTTVAAMMLYEQGKFELDDPIQKFLPEFEGLKVWRDSGNLTKAANSITVRHLMTHTAGLTYNFMQAHPVDAMYRENHIDFLNHDRNLEEHVRLLSTLPLTFEPGLRWGYSVATDVLGRLVEVWSGKSLAEYFDQRIFKPIGMIDTGFHVESEKHERFAALYSPLSGASMSNVARGSAARKAESQEGIKLIESSCDSRFLRPAVSYSGGGGLVGTMADYACFCRMLMNRGLAGEHRILGSRTVEFMRRNQLPEGKDMASMGQPVWSETSYSGIGFGLGFAVVINPVEAQMLTSAGEHHWGGAASTHFWLDPHEDLFVIFFTQLMPSSTYAFRRQLRSQIYGALED